MQMKLHVQELKEHIERAHCLHPGNLRCARRLISSYGTYDPGISSVDVFGQPLTDCGTTKRHTL